MTLSRLSLVATACAAAGAAGASAAVTITQGASAPTYTNTLTFDEPGGPTGTLPGNTWAGLGLSELVAGVGPGTVAQVNTNPGFGWLGTGNVFIAPFGAFLTSSQDLTAFSVRYWDSSGPATFSGGGAAVVVFNDGVEVASLFITNPAFGGVGQSAFNIVADGGSVFDEVRMLGFGFPADGYIDDLSWNTIPSPGAAGLLALGCAAMTRRRR